jgi:hypothetical protein
LVRVLFHPLILLDREPANLLHAPKRLASMRHATVVCGSSANSAADGTDVGTGVARNRYRDRGGRRGPVFTVSRVEPAAEAQRCQAAGAALARPHLPRPPLAAMDGPGVVFPAPAWIRTRQRRLRRGAPRGGAPSSETQADGVARKLYSPRG